MVCVGGSWSWCCSSGIDSDKDVSSDGTATDKDSKDSDGNGEDSSSGSSRVGFVGRIARERASIPSLSSCSSLGWLLLLLLLVWLILFVFWFSVLFPLLFVLLFLFRLTFSTTSPQLLFASSSLIMIAVGKGWIRVSEKVIQKGKSEEVVWGRVGGEERRFEFEKGYSDSVVCILFIPDLLVVMYWMPLFVGHNHLRVSPFNLLCWHSFCLIHSELEQSDRPISLRWYYGFLFNW